MKSVRKVFAILENLNEGKHLKCIQKRKLIF